MPTKKIVLTALHNAKNKYSMLCFLFISIASFPIEFVQAQVVDKEYVNIEEALKEPDKVVRLNLENQKNHDYFKTLAKFKNLQYLNLRNTDLNFIPAEVLTLKNLRVLDIGHNNFSLLPKNFSSLNNLQELYLDEDKNLNLFEDFEILSKLKSLRILHLENDGIKELPKNIGKLSHLEKLYLNDNELETLPVELKNLKNLNYLDVYHNPIAAPLNFIKTYRGGLNIRF